MINNQELLFVVDEFDMPLKPQTRHKVMRHGLWRRTAHVWIINDKKQILCQRRSLLKDSSPGMWEPAVAGHIGPEDNYFTGAVRELYEETGIEVEPQELNLFKIYKDHRFKEYRGIFYYKWSGELHEIVSEVEEVDKIKFVNLDTLKKYIVYQKHPNWFNSGYEKELLSLLKEN